MADLLHELLQISSPPLTERRQGKLEDTERPALDYLSGLSSLSIASIESTEQHSLAQSSHSLLLSLQALSKRSHKAVIQSVSDHANLRSALPVLAASTGELKAAIPRLDNEAVRFSTTYHKSGENEILNSRKRALLLSRNVERLVDVLDLPTLLSSTIVSGSSVPTSNYASALDLNGHIRRLHSLYPDSRVVDAVSAQADEVMQTMAVNLMSTLRTPGLKLASALRTVGWLRRVVPALDRAGASGNGGGLEALFLVCRMSTLLNMLVALEPLRDLADKEKSRQQQISGATGSSWSGGQQAERYLKRYIEIFREQSFAIVSMFKSIFPTPSSQAMDDSLRSDLLQPTPSALSTFPLHLVEMLMETLRVYLPNVKDQTSRESLLTQVLYCAGSLGRLGGDFGVLLASLDVGEQAEKEWVEVVKRHRVMAGRLESIVEQNDRRMFEVAIKA